MRSDDFVQALEPHYDSAVRYCRSLVATGSPSDADDLLQDSLLKALSGFGRLQDQEKFKPWLFSIITKTYASSRRGAFWNRFIPFEEGPMIPHVFDDNELLDEQRLILHALGHLKASERAALLLFELCGFSIDEVRRIQGDRSVSAVKSRLSRARTRARAAIDSLEARHVRNLHDKEEDIRDESIRLTREAREVLGE